jgi:hypothetical protein
VWKAVLQRHSLVFAVVEVDPDCGHAVHRPMADIPVPKDPWVTDAPAASQAGTSSSVVMSVSIPAVGHA